MQMRALGSQLFCRALGGEPALRDAVWGMTIANSTSPTYVASCLPSIMGHDTCEFVVVARSCDELDFWETIARQRAYAESLRY